MKIRCGSFVFPNALLNFEKKQAIKSLQKKFEAIEHMCPEQKEKSFPSCTITKRCVYKKVLVTLPAIILGFL